jgi:hypothetical protein
MSYCDLLDLFALEAPHMGDIAQPDEAVNEMLADVGMTVAAGGGRRQARSRTPEAFNTVLSARGSSKPE